MAAKDPVCGMPVQESNAAATVEHGDRRYQFCSIACKTAFEQAPERYATEPLLRRGDGVAAAALVGASPVPAPQHDNQAENQVRQHVVIVGLSALPLGMTLTKGFSHWH